ncbi:MAG: sodium/hydrogen exchanger, partial [uncultured bacterium]
DVLANFGIALMLYVVGIELDWRKFKELDRGTLLVGFGQILFTGAAGWLAAWLLGFSVNESWFFAVTLTFSSTIVVVKLLSEKRQLESLYGRIAMSILLLQDFLAIIALLVLESIGTHPGANIPWLSLGGMSLKALGLGLLAYILARYVFRKIFIFVGKSQELLFLWSIAWCILFAMLAQLINFPVAISVYFAGLAIGSMDYNFEISARIRSLRDFFIVIFFAYLGSQLILTLPSHLLFGAAFLSLFVVIGNPLIVYLLLRLLGHQERTALFTGLTMGQISEFSFILANVGFALGLINQYVVSMIAVIGLVSMVLSTYAITYNEKLYHLLKPLFHYLPLPKPQDRLSDTLPHDLANHIVVFGYYPTINKVLRLLKAQHETIVVVDYNPANIPEIKAQGAHYIYGDMRDEDILQEAKIQQARMIISIVPYPESNLSLLQYVKHFHIKADTVVIARYLDDIKKFYAAGATYVLNPESISLEYLQGILTSEKLIRASRVHQEEILHLLERQYQHLV